MLSLWLFLHVLGAIAAFGPGFAAPIIGMLARSEPRHAPFAARVNYEIARRLSVPVALTMPVTGVLLILTAELDPAQLWLALGILLYVVAIGFSLLVQVPNARRLVELSSMAPAMPAGPGAAVAGPPPEVRALVARVQQGGIFLALLVVVIVALMVTKPTL